jgi:ABC-type dipeptide/oligopeptide/nickel transport system permease component
MPTYVLRRLLLIIPTLIGMTAIVFSVLANAPGGIGASLLTRTGEMRPDERRAREEYLNMRYGLDQPKVVQYLRWLNKVSPIGFEQWPSDAPEVIEARAEELRLRAPTQAKIDEARRTLRELDISVAANLPKQIELQKSLGSLERELKSINVGPDAGDIRIGDFKPIGFDLGHSIPRGRPVNDLILEALPRTISLQVVALPISYMLAIWLGIQQARKRGSFVDYGTSFTTLALWCVPSIWVAVLLVGFLANEQYLKIFPTFGLNSPDESAMNFLPGYVDGKFAPGWLLDRLYHMALPLICLIYANFAFLSRLTRGALLDNLSADFVRTARAKGLPERVVLYRHAFRTSLIPLITVLVNILPGLIAGSIVVESVFDIKGMGKLVVDAAQQRDFELVLSATFVTGLLTLVAYLLADILYAIADPRVSYD